MKKIFTFFAALCIVAISFAQLPYGSYAPDFSLYEIDKTTGNMVTDQTINLYDMLNDYKVVFIDVSATTCSPCYSFHQGGTMESLYNNYGPNSSVNDTRVLFVEGASTGNSWAAINGSAGSNYWDCTHVYGSTTEQVPYPVIPLRIAPNYPSNYNSFHSGYNIHYFPTMYMVCPNRLIFELGNAGTNNAASTFHSYAAQYCPATTNTNDATLGIQQVADDVYFCEVSFQPQIVLQNVGSATMTSATLRITHGTNVQDISWTGNLAQYEKETVTLPVITGTENGQQSWSVEIINVNGQADEGSINNIHTETFTAQITSDINTATQNFSSSNLGDWTLVDNTDGYFGVYNGALRLRAYYASDGTTGECYAPLMNFSNSNTPSLTFDWAHRRYSSSNDKLQVKVSSDCGATWTTVWEKSGASLATVTTGNGEFNATSSQYQTAGINLTSFANQPKVIVKFVFTSDYGNNIFVDNINISNTPVGIETVEESSLSIFPNPAKDVLNINYDKAINQIDVYDVNGKLVKTFTTVGNSINVSDLASGMYMLNIQTEDGMMVKSIVKE